MVVEPFPVGDDPFLCELETEWNGPAPGIPDCASYFDPVETVFIESIIHEKLRRPRHDPFSLISFSYPITDHRDPVLPIDRMVADNSRKLPFKPNPGLKAPVMKVLFAGRSNKAHSIGEGDVAVHPREPFSQVLAIRIDESEEALRIGALDESQLSGKAAGKWKVHAVVLKSLLKSMTM